MLCKYYNTDGVKCMKQGSFWQDATWCTDSASCKAYEVDRDAAKDIVDSLMAKVVAPVEAPEESSLTGSQVSIANMCDSIKELLLDKNRKYGDSAINPVRIFSSSSPVEQINVRIDDKISRLISGQTDDTEDVELDLIGYLILKRVADGA